MVSFGEGPSSATSWWTFVYRSRVVFHGSLDVENIGREVKSFVTFSCAWFGEVVRYVEFV